MLVLTLRFTPRRAQVLVQVPQKNSVITWDFDVLKGDVTFTIYRSREHLSSPRHEHHVPGAAGGIGSQQYISKRMSVGVDLVTCCQPCICRDGDSIQVFACSRGFTGQV